MTDTSPFEQQDRDADAWEWFDDEGATSILNALNATTQAEQWMHATARVALINLLVRDPTVDALFWRWMHATRFGRAVYDCVEHYARCAEGFGLANANEFIQFARNAPADGRITIEVADGSDREQISRTLNALVDEANRRLDEVIASSADLDPTPLVDEAITLVRDEWNLPWPWLAVELGRAWLFRMLDCVLVTRSTVNVWVESGELERPAPTIDFHFATKPDETIGEAYERFLGEVDEGVIGPLAEAATPLPKGRLTDDETANRYVGWWYRKTILKESIRSIADKNDDKRALVRYGIEQAERWLYVSNCVWKEQDAA